MSKKTTVTISVLIFLLYAAALLFFGGSIFFEAQKGAQLGSQQFSAIKALAGSESDQSGFMTPDFISRFRSRLGSNQNLVAITLQQTGKTVFAWPANGAAIRVNEAMEPVIQTSSPITKVFSANFPLADNGQAVVTAAFYVITPQYLEKLAKQTFLLIMAGTVIALLAGIFSCALADKKSTAKTFSAAKANTGANSDNKRPAEAAATKAAPAAAVIPPETATTLNETSAVPQNGTASAADNSELDERLYEQEINSLFDDDVPVDSSETAPAAPENGSTTTTAAAADAVPSPAPAGEKPKVSARIDPMGLFSPQTGLGWESYLETRLDAELIRSASSERDLALLLVSVQGVPHSDELAARIAETLLEYFNYRDMLFEFGSDSYAIILQDSEFDHTMHCAESLYGDINNIIAQSHRPLTAAIGISTRAQRLITGSRLINEAAVALKKAGEENELPIVAFKVNTEKYRKYLNEELRSGLIKNRREQV